MPSDLSALSQGELITLIFKQAREIDTLKETIIELQEKLKQKTDGDDSSKKYHHLLNLMFLKLKLRGLKPSDSSSITPSERKSAEALSVT